MKTIYLILALVATMLTSCASINPKLITDGVQAHSTLPNLAVSVQECVADHPEVRSQIIEPFNVLVDKWGIAKDKGTEELVLEAASTKRHLSEIGTAWRTIKGVIVAADIDCGSWVKSSVAQKEAWYDDTMDAIEGNERAVYWLEVGNIVAGMVAGRRGEVVRMGK